MKPLKVVLCFVCSIVIWAGGLFASYAQSVAPILGDTWRHQQAPFNKYCPHYDERDEACDVGCVATSCETIMTYYGRPVTLPVLFTEAGERTLRISPDDSTFLWQRTVTVHPATPEASLHFSSPRITPQGTTAHIALDVSNTSPTTDAGASLIFCLFPGTGIPSPADGDTRHYAYLYTPAASSETIEMDFHGLTPGQTYTLLLRQPWQPIWAEGHTFTLPVPEGLNAPSTDGKPMSLFKGDSRGLFDLQGRHVPDNARGLFLQQRKKVLKH